MPRDRRARHARDGDSTQNAVLAKAVQNPFIVNTSPGKASASVRKIIRSHVMRGKNLGKTRQKKRATLASWIDSSSKSSSKEFTVVADGRSRINCGTALESYYYSEPGRGVSVFSLMQLPCEVDPSMQDMLSKFFTVVKNAMYPIDICSIQRSHCVWMNGITSDLTVTHCILFITHKYFDILDRGHHKQTAMIHLSRTLELLQQKLETVDLATSNSTIAVVQILTLAADLLGDEDSAKKHLQGLQRIVNLRGGLGALRESRTLQAKVCSCDIHIAMKYGNPPVFFGINDISWNAYIAKEKHKLLYSVLECPDARLVHVWRDLEVLTTSANVAAQTGQMIDYDNFQDVMITVQYRLLHLQYSDDNGCGVYNQNRETSYHRLLHLVLVALSTTISVQIRGIAVTYESIARRMKNSLREVLDESDVLIPLEIQLWVLFIAGISVLPEDEWVKWKIAELTRNRVESPVSWADMRDNMKKYLWIDALHDGPGKNLYDGILATI
ncbi:hypothetical protein BX600DRAFT_554262 [Xylariales sp. PMI_506]|nr:hypothetical protein BX600DRAFT_554262 [Xylariales sp. PMI_506]